MRRPVLGSFIVHRSKCRTFVNVGNGGWIQQSIPALHYLTRKYIQEPTVDRRHEISSSVETMLSRQGLTSRVNLKTGTGS